MAFVRVKRRHDEDPYNSIVVSHKKLKSICSDFSVDCVFQFAATVRDEVSYRRNPVFKFEFCFTSICWFKSRFLIQTDHSFVLLTNSQRVLNFFVQYLTDGLKFHDLGTY